MTAPGPLVAYYRVSTQQQGVSGLGLAAQRATVEAYVRAAGSTLLAEYTEVESGKKVRRPELTAALERCRASGGTLVIAKLDRLARNVVFLATLMKGDVPFLALDLPGATPFTLHILAAVAEQEALAISERTKAALKAAKARGTKLGNDGSNLTADARARSIASRRAVVDERDRVIVPLVRAWRRARWTLQKIADELTRLGIAPPRGRGAWRASQVARVVTVARRSTRRRRASVRQGSLL